MKDIEKHLTELKERVNRIESKKDTETAKQEEIDSLKTRISKINPIEEKLKELEKRVRFELTEQLNRNLSDLDKDYDRLAAKDQVLKQKINDEVSAIKKENETLKLRLNSFEGLHLADKIEETAQRLEKLEELNLSEEMAHKKDVDSLKNKLTDISDHLNAFEDSVKASKQHISNLRNQIGSLSDSFYHRLEDHQKKVEELTNTKVSNNSLKVDKAFSEVEELRSEIWELVKQLNEFKEKASKEFDEIEKNKSGVLTKVVGVEESLQALKDRINNELVQRVIKIEENNDLMKAETYDLDKRIEKYNSEMEDQNARIGAQREDIESTNAKVYELQETQKRTQSLVSELEKKEESMRANLLWMDKFKSEFSDLKERVDKDLVIYPEFERLKQSSELIWKKLNDASKLEAQVSALKEVLADINHNIQVMNSEILNTKNNVKEALEKANQVPMLKEQENQHEKLLTEYQDLFEKRNLELLDLGNTVEKLTAKVFSLQSDQEKVKDNISELREIERELKETLEEIKKLELEKYKGRVERLESSKAGKQEIDILKETFEATKKKNTELIEMLLEKMGM